MDKRHKDLLRRTVGELRRTLAGGEDARGDWQRGDLDRELERLGIAPDGARTPLSALPGLTDGERRAHEAAVAMLADVPADRLAAVRAEVVERAAYTWINRLLALRAMETRGLIDETLRGNPAYSGASEALFVLRQTAPARCAGPDGGWWAVIEDACASQEEDLPGLFDLADPVAALRPSTAGLQRCIQLVGGAPAGYDLAECDAAYADPDAIGWAYQFYQEEAKKRIDARLKSGGKVTSRSDIAAKTQLFTEPYMVKWLLQNSLGRSYHELYPDSKLPGGWEYYIRELPNDEPPPRCATSLAGLTFMDPCCGSGHFEREAFDMLAAMYCEEEPSLSAAEIADRIFTHHLHGIDIDPRAVQLTALTLYLRARELVAAERRAARQPGPGAYRPPIMRLAATPTGLPEGSLERHLARHPEDQVLAPFLEGIFHALENADILGSLLRPSEDLQKAIAALAATGTLAMDFDPDAMALRQEITARAGSDPEGLGRDLLDRIAATFAAEAGAGQDVAAALFGHEAAEGVRLLRLLGERYAVVGTNPPYMGSGGMGTLLRRHVEKNYESGKRDLYSSFVLRCIGLSRVYGRVAMVTMQSWLFLRSFANLRAMPDVISADPRRPGGFTGLLRETRIDALAHLGPGAFEEIGGEVVQSVLFVLGNAVPSLSHRMLAWRLVGAGHAPEKGAILRSSSRHDVYVRNQLLLTSIPEAPVVYWVPSRILDVLKSDQRLGCGPSRLTGVHIGLCTGSNQRFIRYAWEVPSDRQRWPYCARAGRYQKWWGLNYSHAAWRIGAEEYRETAGSAVRNVDKFFRDGATCGLMSRGAAGARLLWGDEMFEQASIGLIPAPAIGPYEILAALNNRVASYLLRVTTQELKFNAGYVERMPCPRVAPTTVAMARACVGLKRTLVAGDPLERSFVPSACPQFAEAPVSAVLGLVEGLVELHAVERYELLPDDLRSVLAETGTPAGFHPLVAAYDALPDLPPDLDLPPLPRDVIDYLDAHARIHPTPAELARVKARLRALYEAGPGAKDVAGGDADEAGEGAEDGDEGEVVAGAYIPIPTETFLEELSVKMQLHPISVYWLLEELRAEGARCKPEELRLLEDRLSVLVLRLLGHRWPRQVEAGEAVPDWADGDGIIPVTAGAGEPTLADRLRERLRAEDGDLGAQRTEALLAELTGLALDEWVRRQFYPRHMRQFKQRPIAWHLASRPGAAGGKKTAGRRLPAFECFLYYHASGLDALGRIRTLYVEPLLRADRQRLADARQAGDDGAAGAIYERVNELEDFNNRLRQVEETAFACPELDAFLAKEPLDRWCGDGYVPPAGAEAFAAQERAWRVDINDGVRVNIAPVQQAGLLAADLLKAKDAAKAIADRARWRADERRWVRDGKLPRCGWMPEGVPESPRWTERAPEREAERAKLEEKRRKVREKMGITADHPTWETS